MITGTRNACCPVTEIHPVAVLGLASAVVGTISFCLVSCQRYITVIVLRSPCACLRIARVAGCAFALYSSAATGELRTGFCISTRISNRVPVADNIAAVCIVAVFGIDVASAVNSVCHTESINIVIQRMIVTPSHKPRASGERFIELVAGECHARITVILCLDISSIIRIAQNDTVFMQAERTVRNGAVVCIVAAG